jgi:hypothetical protein
MASFNNDLSPLQWKILRAFFALEKGFFLTGGAALVGFHLHHRTTSDLDVFTTDEQTHIRALRMTDELSQAIGATIETKHQYPGFLRRLIHGDDETVVLDIVLDRVPQALPTKLIFDGIAVDPPEEVLTNKLTTLLSRSEERDLIDVMALEHAGYRIDNALPLALEKDAACTPAQLAFILSEIRIPDGVELPGRVAPADLRQYVKSLVTRLRRLAYPGQDGYTLIKR